MSSNFDVGSTYFVSGPSETNHQNTGNDYHSLNDDPSSATKKQITRKLFDFLNNFRIDSLFEYRNQLKNNLLIPEFSLTVDTRHLQAVDPDLAFLLVSNPSNIIPCFETAIRDLALSLEGTGDSIDPSLLPDFQLLIKSSSNISSMREINSSSLNKLVRISGIVSAASSPTARATQLHLYCRSCRHAKIIPVEKGFSGVTIPRVCENNDATGSNTCPLDPYLVDHEKTKQIDQQILRLQELPENVPVGELPRHVLLAVDRYLTGIIYPGTRVLVTGTYDVFQKNSKGSDSRGKTCAYLRVVGIEAEIESKMRSKHLFSPAEDAKFIALSKKPDIFESFARSVAPSIYGNEDIKKSVACLLLGGSKKVLPDGMRLRGDINVLLLGDPGTAKSQLLKFVEKVSPISVYTSGKGSSAAGLTASVIRDPNSGEFYLEGGAMVLADGGVVCIDEFDKMREEDRVAIHEAMEQQTISIAKAGITTILNSRTSVLAAANPVFGRYDDMKTPGENIDFQTTILSRFDMIYILRDEHLRERDEALAKHVLSVHASSRDESHAEGELDIQTMKGYIAYCKRKCAPRLGPEAREKLASHFVSIRSQVQTYETETNSRSSIPITIRQLEAIVRISESIAKFSLSPIVTEAHVDEAIRLFRVSTYAATKSGYVVGESMMMGKFKQEVIKVQEDMRKRLPIGSKMSESSLKDFLRRRQYSEYAIDRALNLLQSRGSITFANQGRSIIRYPLTS